MIRAPVLLLLCAWPLAARAGFNPPATTKFSINKKGFYLEFQWSPTKPPNFPLYTAVEFEVHVEQKCFGAPTGGKDISTAFKKDAVESNLKDDPSLGAYVDVWNYYVPATGTEAQKHIGGPGCGWTEKAATLAFYDPKKVTADDDGNFAVGVLNAKALKAGKLYNISYTFDGTGPSALCATSRVSIIFRPIPNTCTYTWSPKGQPVATHISSCAFFLGAPDCMEMKGSPLKYQEIVISRRICAPTGAVVVQGTDGTSEGECIDADGDGWLRSCGDPPKCFFMMRGTQARDCHDDDPLISPSAPEVCQNSKDDNCDGKVDCDDLVCKSAPSCAKCGTQGAPCCAGGSCIAPGLDCSKQKNVCLQSPCFGKMSGAYCGKNLPQYQGLPNDLVICKGGAIEKVDTCEFGCVVMPPTIPDYCDPTPIPKDAGPPDTAAKSDLVQKVDVLLKADFPPKPDAPIKLDAGTKPDAAKKPDGSGNPDTSIDGVADASCQVGATVPCLTGLLGVCSAGVRTCSAGGWSLCVGLTSPSAESCDGKDNNCDGKADEAFPTLGQACTAGLGECKTSGVVKCKADGLGVECSAKAGVPTTETCDGKDNNCDGLVDEGDPGGGGLCITGKKGVCSAGLYKCEGGALACKQIVSASGELCNGLDDDCDGLKDEDFQTLGQSCSVGVAECKATGVYQCKADGPGVECSVKAGEPTTEACDGKDNDCDGQIDENASGWPLTQTCYTGPPGTLGVGVCKAGIQTCTLGAWSSCVGEVLPSTDVCDGKDNDCDGTVDKGCQYPCDPPNIYYKDADGDQYGEPGSPLLGCSAPPGYVANSSDCDDANGLLYPGQTVLSTLESNPNWGGIGSFSSLAIDATNKFHISYYYGATKNVQYITNSSGTPVSTFVANAEMSSPTSLALDSKGKVHFAFNHYVWDMWGGNGELRYATNATGTWQVSIIDSGKGAIGQYPSLRLDAADKVHVSYEGTNGLTYITNGSGAWVKTTVDTVNNYPSLVLDPAGKAHVAYVDWSPADLKYATNKSGLWATMTIETSGWTRTPTSIAVDSTGFIHISYGDNGALKYATNKSGGWSTAFVGAGLPFPNWSSLTVDKGNKVHISFADNATKYANNLSGNWMITTLDSSNHATGSDSIFVNALGKIHVSYYYDNWPSPGGSFKYAQRCN